MMKLYEELEVCLFNMNDEVFYKGYKRCDAVFVDGENTSDIVFPKVKYGG